MNRYILITAFFLFCAMSAPPDRTGNTVTAITAEEPELYKACGLDKILDENVFRLAFSGYEKIASANKKVRPVLVIVDYTLASTVKRFYVIDLAGKKLVYNCLVAHGRETGENFAKHFSNDVRCNASSLGFYLTSNTYIGKNGYSLRLLGLEKGFNDTAYERAVVIHGADYVSDDFIKKYGRIGRSWGCPALPKDLSREIIDYIKNGACLFLYFKDDNYLKNSVYCGGKSGK